MNKDTCPTCGKELHIDPPGTCLPMAHCDCGKRYFFEPVNGNVFSKEWQIKEFVISASYGGFKHD